MLETVLLKPEAKVITSIISDILRVAKTQLVAAPAPKKDIVKELKGLKELLDAGVLTQAECDKQKARILD